ncbi:MAG: tRNA uridine-5-carboxymethylaminomethyl(34) synthesis GTPase MnmE [Ignavibacteriae bacterium]|nr:tRNA uridine-5-carboxymethylaminomethyl(34) synthesis GTPase MnmE [Ignavibacteriota bacterium]MCB9214679.1 tRNA uridine-5-carboxymethylaminomethyl(34) synthesis GTPase MnmE [Ignavibacteria bacterium]
MSSVQPIVARATPLGEGAIAIVRLSGSGVFEITDQLFFPDRGGLFSTVPERTMSIGRLVDGDRSLDHPLAVRFQAPRSYTGEDMVELHLHGNPLIVDSTLQLFLRKGCRLAEPGEFSRRAFLNGKMDLAQAEGLADLIRAESDIALDLAQQQLGGELSRRFSHFRHEIVDFLALIELELDFVQEGYELLDYEKLSSTLQSLLSDIRDLLVSYRTGDLLRRGPRILLLGRPNAGKSSLFNAILGYSRSLVSSQPGTTRDYVEERIFYRGVVLHFLDSAGIRETDDDLEAQGVSFATNLIPLADHVLYLIDSSLPESTLATEDNHFISLSQKYSQSHFLKVYSKQDIGVSIDTAHSVSVFDRLSVEHLLDSLIAQYSTHKTDSLILLTQRQHQKLLAIESFLSSISNVTDTPTELLATDLRAILQPLSELTGAVTNEDILDAVFSGFCIGK